MTRLIKLGSLFSGSGGFELAGQQVGITPVWASEIAPFPTLVTYRRFPDMKHFGDVSKIDGAKVPKVDVVTFGSPCQDLSVAGRGKGLSGSRSGLFFEAIRVIKQMRVASSGKYPRFALWENVPGALYSNKGADFYEVLGQIVSVASEKWASKLPRPARWQGAGAIVDSGFSLAWRVLDAQYFGLPQRRKRIYLVADFADQSAPEILFERQGESRPSCPVEEAGQAVAGKAEESPRELGDTYALRMRSGKPGGGKGALVQTNLSGTIGCGNDQVLFVPTVFGFNSLRLEQKKPSGRYGVELNVSKTLDTSGLAPTCNQGGVAVVEGMDVRKLTPLECARLQGFPDWWTDDLAIENPSDDELDFWTGVHTTWDKARGLKKIKTPAQVARWLKNPVSDGQLYSLWGNAVAVPCARFVLSRLAQIAQSSTAIQN